MENITIRKVQKTSFCNSCGVSNYGDDAVDRLLEIQIGGLASILCPSCALYLSALLSDELCDVSEDSKN